MYNIHLDNPHCFGCVHPLAWRIHPFIIHQSMETARLYGMWWVLLPDLQVCYVTNTHYSVLHHVVNDSLVVNVILFFYGGPFTGFLIVKATQGFLVAVNPILHPQDFFANTFPGGTAYTCTLTGLPHFGSLKYRWLMGQLNIMLFCVKPVWKNLCSQILVLVFNLNDESTIIMYRHISLKFWAQMSQKWR